jgi:hypothetical protein
VAAKLGEKSVGGVGRASLIVAVYLALVVILLGTVFRHRPGGFVATIVSVPVVVSALIYYSRLHNPVLARGVKRHLTRAGTLTGLLGIVTAILLDVASGISALLWIAWGLVVGIPLAAAGIRILCKARSETHA